LPAYAELLLLRTVEFDLERRLMRYPCSYMIYNEALVVGYFENFSV
jgi:hypothetical protein